MNYEELKFLAFDVFYIENGERKNIVLPNYKLNYYIFSLSNSTSKD